MTYLFLSGELVVGRTPSCCVVFWLLPGTLTSLVECWPSVDLAETRYLSDHRGSEPRGLARLKEHEQDMLTKYWKPSFQHHPGELIFGSRNSPRCFSEKKNVLRKSELSIQISPPWSSFLDPDPPRPGGNSDTHIFRK